MRLIGKFAAAILATAGVAVLAACDGGCDDVECSYASDCPAIVSWCGSCGLGDSVIDRSDASGFEVSRGAPGLPSVYLDTSLPDYDSSAGIVVTDWSGISRSTGLAEAEYATGSGPAQFEAAYERDVRVERSTAVTADRTFSRRIETGGVPDVGIGMAPMSGADRGFQAQTDDGSQRFMGRIETPIAPRGTSVDVNGDAGVAPIEAGGGVRTETFREERTFRDRRGRTGRSDVGPNMGTSASGVEQRWPAGATEPQSMPAGADRSTDPGVTDQTTGASDRGVGSGITGADAGAGAGARGGGAAVEAGAGTSGGSSGVSGTGVNAGAGATGTSGAAMNPRGGGPGATGVDGGGGNAGAAARGAGGGAGGVSGGGSSGGGGDNGDNGDGTGGGSSRVAPRTPAPMQYVNVYDAAYRYAPVFSRYQVTRPELRNVVAPSMGTASTRIPDNPGGAGIIVGSDPGGSFLW